MMKQMIERAQLLKPKFWSKQRKEVLSVVEEQLTLNDTITESSLNVILQKIQGDAPHCSIEQIKRVATVLTFLKDELGLETVIPAVPIKVPRPSILPTKSLEFSKLDGVIQLQDVFWDDWLQNSLNDTSKQQQVDDILTFSLAFCLTSNVGMRNIQIEDALAYLSFDDVLGSGESLKFKVHPKDRLKRYSIIHLPSPVKIILKKIIQSKQHTGAKRIFELGKDSKFKGRRNRIRRILDKRYANLCDYALKQNEVGSYPVNWKAYTHIAHLIPFNHGVEPFIITALQNYPLPVSHPLESFFSLRGELNSDSYTLGGKELVNTNQKKLITEKWSTDDKKSSVTVEDWCGISKNILIQLVRRLKSITLKKIHTDQQIQTACQEIQLSLSETDKISANQKSAVHLALFWILDFISHDKSINPETVQEYFSRVFYHGILCFADSNDLSTWELEDHELAFEASISRAGIGTSRKKNIIATYKKVYQFANQLGFSPAVNIQFCGDEWVGSSTRIEMISLSKFDTFTKLMWETQDRQNITIAVTAILAFYGGLRASETSRLTLNDMLIYDKEIYIEIQNGKTPAARRRIPLHLFAPEQACDWVRIYYEKRYDEFREREGAKRQIILKHIPLFGPKKKRERYNRSSLVAVTIAALKYYLSDTLVYHSLRHSFASWLLLRWYANRYPDFSNQLSEKRHPIFQEACQRRLRSFFTLNQSHIPKHNASDLVKFAKVLGHSGTETMFSTYIHSFDAVHQHAMQRISDVSGARILNGKTIAAIVPKMKSRTSQAKSNDKTINGLI